MVLKNKCIKEEITGKIRKYLEINENTTYQYFEDTVKALVREKCTDINI